MDGSGDQMPKKMPQRPIEAVRRYAYTREESAISIGVSTSHFERCVQAELKVIPSGQLILVPPIELERWVQRNARYLAEPVRPRLVG
jgi:hypothetical protein